MSKLLKDKKLYIILLVVIAFFGNLVLMNYSVDTYLLLASPKLRYVYEYFSAGRFITGGFFFIQGLLHLPEYFMYISSYILAIIFATLSIYELNKILDKYVSNKILSIILSIGIIVNPFVIELWLFIETGIMMLSILSCIEAYKYFDNYLQNKEKKALLKSFVWMVVALFSYQGTVGIFAALSVFSILKYSKNIKDFIKNNVIMFIIYFVPTIVNYIFVILFSRERVGSNHDFIKVFKMIISSTRELLLNAFGLLPRGVFPLFLIVSLIITIYYIYNDKNKIKLLLSVLYGIAIIYLFTVAPIIPQNSDSLIMFPRTSYVFGSIIGIVFVIINNKNNVKVLGTVIVLLLVVELCSFIKIEVNRYILNYKDREIIEQVNEKIEEYENATGYEIKNISFYNQENSHMFYDHLEDYINVSAKNERPNSLALFVYYTDRKVEEIDNSKVIYNDYFKDNHWQSFNLNQVVLDGDTIHWYIY